MTSIVIVDASKPSVVMTSEIFKDKIPGILVFVAGTAKEAIEHVMTHSPKLVVIDFDLPDADGPSLVEVLRKSYEGPILLTAFPDKVVKDAVAEHLFTHSDASEWISKPIQVDRLNQAIDQFLLNGRRIKRRFVTNIDTQLIAKAAGRGKRAPKVEGKILNLSIGGACVKISGSLKLKKSQELTLSLSLLPSMNPLPDIVDDCDSLAGGDTKIRSTVAWAAAGKVGLIFSRLTDVQKSALLSHLRTSIVVVDEMWST